MTNQSVIYLIVLNILFSCKSETNKTLVPVITEDTAQISMNQVNGSNINELEKGVFDGDIESYHKLRDFYLDQSPEAFLFWAMIMANKYDNPEACVDVFDAVLGAHGSLQDFYEIDPTTQKFMLEYLSKSISLGNEDAIELKEELDKIPVGGSLEKEQI